MWFEGSEKKMEVVSRGARLRQRPETFWNEAVERAQAKILSKISSETCDAYLLSESSLFVWDERVLMITCGRTTLAKAGHFFIDQFGAEKIDLFTYERKNEFYPHHQPTDFMKDVADFNRRLNGKAFRFGSPDDHHVFLYHSEHNYVPTPGDTTLEVLMYSLAKPVCDSSGLPELFPGFLIDDYKFEPQGYSLNALRGSHYYTIHVTPEEHGSYASFETNLPLGSALKTTVAKLVQRFQPRSFDVVSFHAGSEVASFDIRAYRQKSFVRETLSCGYEVGFSTHFKPVEQPAAALSLEPLL